MLKKDEKILNYLSVHGEYADEYFCSVYYKNKDRFMYSVLKKIQEWCEKNGGSCTKLSDKKVIIGTRKGFLVKIRFPLYNKRNMKEIMETLY